MAETLPALFIGHGSPMNAIERTPYTAAWEALAPTLPRPRAILAISAHWYVPGTRATASPAPRTIHDFGGFPRALFEVRYPAPGDPALVERLRALLAPAVVIPDERWGLDHGAWSVLVHLFPKADVPVVQLSVDELLEPADYLTLGATLGALRDEGILVVASGNVVHNLRAMAPADAAPYPWAVRFDAAVREAIVADERALLAALPSGDDGRLAVPSFEHFAPLLYVVGMRRPGEPVTFPVEGFDAGGAIAMTSVRVG